jgi:hypothetical protein
MHTLNQRTVFLGTLLLLFVSVSAIGDANLSITIINDNPDALLVSAYDSNTQPRAAILAGQKIYGFASILISITSGPRGTGRIYWTAVSVDSVTHRCGHQQRSGLQDNAVVHVYAKSKCQAPQQ